MRARNQEIVMPEKSRVMTREEMEYEGGFLNFVIGLTASAVSIGATILGATGVVDKYGPMVKCVGLEVRWW